MPLLFGPLHAGPDEVDLLINGLGRVALEGNVDYPVRWLEQRTAENPNEPRYAEALAAMRAVRARVSGVDTMNHAEVNSEGFPITPLPDFPATDARPGRAFTTATAGVAMVWIDPGKVWLSAVHGSDDDTLVTLSRGYWLGRTEVTQAQWESIMDNIPRPSQFRGAHRPAERLSWVSAMEFCKKVDERERAAGRVPAGYEYTLPTEAQWEYACRAGTTDNFAGEIEALAWYRINSGQQTHPVGQKQPNAWGLHDMHGNVSEWCADGYQGYPGGEVTDLRGDYLAPSAATFRITRGGGWASNAGECRPNYRAWQPLNTTNTSTGFRLALVPQRLR